MASEYHSDLIPFIDQLILNAEKMCGDVSSLDRLELKRLEERQEGLLAKIEEKSQDVSDQPSASELKLRSDISQKLSYFQELNTQFVRDLGERYALVHADEAVPQETREVLNQVDQIRGRLNP
jgi:hypothetical protein